MSDITFPNSNAFDVLLAASRPTWPVVDGRVVGPGVIKAGHGVMVNSVLPIDSWRATDAAVQMVAQPILAATNTIRGMAGMVDTVASYGTMVSRYVKASGVDNARMDMTGRVTPKLDRVEYEYGGAPIPVFSAGFEIGARELAAAMQSGESVDTSSAEASANDVADLMETTFVSGSSMKYDGYTLYGLLNQPQRLTDTAANYGGGTWDTDIDNVVKTFGGVYTALCAKNQYGPYTVFLATQEYNILATTFASGTSQTALERVRGLEWVQSIVHTPKMTAGQAAFLQANRKTLVMKEHAWLGVNEFVAPVTGTHNFVVKAVLGWMFKPDYDGNLGLLHVTSLHS